MCFSPQISLITALVEFLLVAVILIRFRKSLVSRFIAIIIFFLGFYQFTEFMLCSSTNIDLWIRLGFVTYTFLPALALHAVLKLLRPKHKFLFLYLPPIIFSAIALLYKGFVISGVCHSIFISVNTVFFSHDFHAVFSIIYGAYYAGFIFLASLFAAKQIIREKDKFRKRLLVIGLAGVLLATIPAFTFVIIFPYFRIMFPSVYCEFALLAAIAGYIVSYMHYKHKFKK